MKIGIDFDNTIICYDGIFHQVALEQGLIPQSLAPEKNAIRDYLRQVGKEDEWTRMQGYVYGLRLIDAKPFLGVVEFFAQCKEREIPLHIISHKTRYPYAGEKHDLHKAAYDWLEFYEFLNPDRIGLGSGDVFFEPTQEKKIERIIKSQCTHFIDDLPEFLMRDDFPPDVQKILFGIRINTPGLKSAPNWGDLSALIIPA